GQAALDLCCDVCAVQLRVLGIELTVNVGYLPHEQRVDGWMRPGDPASSREVRGRLAHPVCDERLGVFEPGDADRDLLEGRDTRACKPGHERLEHARALGHGSRHRADVVEARRQWKAAVARHET